MNAIHLTDRFRTGVTVIDMSIHDTNVSNMYGAGGPWAGFCITHSNLCGRLREEARRFWTYGENSLSNLHQTNDSLLAEGGTGRFLKNHTWYRFWIHSYLVSILTGVYYTPSLSIEFARSISLSSTSFIIRETCHSWP